MTREEALLHVVFAVDDTRTERLIPEIPMNAVLVGWRHPRAPIFVAVWAAHVNTPLYQGDAIDIATEFLDGINWFADGTPDPDYVIGGT